MRLARLVVIPIAVLALAGCSLLFPSDESQGSGKMTDMLITEDTLDLVPGATIQQSNEAFSWTVDDYLDHRASSIPPIEPAECGNIPVDLVLIDKDRGSSGTIYIGPQLMVDGALIQQTGREFATGEEAGQFYSDYKRAISACPSFVVKAGEGLEISVDQTVADAGISGVDSFVVELDIDNPSSTSTKNTQYVMLDGKFMIMVSSGAAETEDQRRAALKTVLDVVSARLVHDAQ